MVTNDPNINNEPKANKDTILNKIISDVLDGKTPSGEDLEQLKKAVNRMSESCSKYTEQATTFMESIDDIAEDDMAKDGIDEIEPWSAPEDVEKTARQMAKDLVMYCHAHDLPASVYILVSADKTGEQGCCAQNIPKRTPLLDVYRIMAFQWIANSPTKWWHKYTTRLLRKVIKQYVHLFFDLPAGSTEPSLVEKVSIGDKLYHLARTAMRRNGNEDKI